MCGKTQLSSSATLTLEDGFNREGVARVIIEADSEAYNEQILTPNPTHTTYLNYFTACIAEFWDDVIFQETASELRITRPNHEFQIICTFSQQPKPFHRLSNARHFKKILVTKKPA